MYRTVHHQYGYSYTCLILACDKRNRLPKKKKNHFKGEITAQNTNTMYLKDQQHIHLSFRKMFLLFFFITFLIKLKLKKLKEKEMLDTKLKNCQTNLESLSIFTYVEQLGLYLLGVIRGMRKKGKTKVNIRSILKGQVFKTKIFRKSFGCPSFMYFLNPFSVWVYNVSMKK